MFNKIKATVDLVEQLSKDTGLTFIESGENTLSIEDDDSNGCPACGHHGCFKIKYDPSEPEAAFYKCFSCDESGSVIDWVALRDKIPALDAAYKLVKEHNIELPKDFSPVQELFNIAAGYYQNCMREVMNKPQSKLARMTPLNYQLNVRKHKAESLESFKVGYSDGKLIEFLEGLGYDEELLLESGLKSKKTGKDFLPSDCFIYPHFSKGRVSHYTFKDSAKKLAYQLPNKHVLNGCEFYNQDSIKANTVIVVEGENDVISTAEHSSVCSFEYGVIGTIGQISVDQLNWMKQHLEGKHVITIFDGDSAGDRYREKVQKLKNSFKSLVQVKPPDEGDIDDMLQTGKKLEDIIKDFTVKIDVKVNYEPPKALTQTKSEVGAITTTQESSTMIESEDDNSNAPNKGVFEKFGSYHSVKQDKSGDPVYKKLSNFTMKLVNVFITEDGDRLREVIVTREDGFVSEPIRISSEVKVSLKSFRVFLARAADADFFGTENELSTVWELVFAKAPEVLIKVTRVVGRSEPHKGWIFRNKFITDAGVEINPDESGVFWLEGKKIGICPESLNKNVGVDGNGRDIPSVNTDLSDEEVEALIKGVIENLGKNLGDMGTALVMMAWFNSVAYSNQIFNFNKGFPMLFVNGSNGQGKGTICGWLMDIYDMAVTGKTTVAQLKSGVGFGRKAEYYASLPLFVDEIRADLETKLYQDTFRSYYDRDGRTMGTRDGFGVKTQEVRSCFMYAGEDHFEDPATKERCITVRIKKIGRELAESFLWIDNRKEYLSAIGLHWIKESVVAEKDSLKASIKALDKALVLEAGCSSRKSKNWAVVGHFALKLAAKYAPEFDMKAFLFKTSTDDSVMQKSETTVSQFFETVESIMSQEGIPKITNSHITTEGTHLHIWFPHVYRVVNEANRGQYTFSKNALLNAIKEEPYFVSDSKKMQLGLDGTRRVVITLDLTKAPDSIKNVALTNT